MTTTKPDITITFGFAIEQTNRGYTIWLEVYTNNANMKSHKLITVQSREEALRLTEVAKKTFLIVDKCKEPNNETD